MAEIDRIREEIRNEVMEDVLKQILKSLTPKEVKVLDLLTLSDKEIANELGGKPGTISQDTSMIYSKFADPGIINFRGRNKKATMAAAWREIQERYKEFLPVSKQGS